jgi:hypothetical protein
MMRRCFCVIRRYEYRKKKFDTTVQIKDLFCTNKVINTGRHHFSSTVGTIEHMKFAIQLLN